MTGIAQSPLVTGDRHGGVKEGVKKNGRFRRDVLRGLSASPKTLPCKYFYDDRGSRLFDRICELDDYYLTRTELAVMQDHAAEMARCVGPRCVLVELGSGSSLKTRVLLDHLKAPSAYVPVDISGAQLKRTAASLAAEYRALDVIPLCGDFTTQLELPEGIDKPYERVVVYFPGSTIGNFGPPAAIDLLKRVAALAGDGGGLLIGVDLKKDVEILERAYNDGEGVTAEFNRNLLRRINRDLGADFDLDNFQHQAVFNDQESRIEMHLVSGTDQKVRVGGRSFEFDRGETIHTENSYKYTLDHFRELADAAGFAVDSVWTDENDLFSVQYLTLPTMGATA